MSPAHLQLTLAILTEVAGTLALKAANGFTVFLPSLIVVVCYSASFYFLSIVLKTLPVGFTYAIWSGVGIVLTTICAAVFYRQQPDLPAIIGMALIIAGAVVLNLFSKMGVAGA